MRRVVALLIFGLFLGAPAQADSWPPAKVLARASANGQFVVRVIPGESTGDVFGFVGMPKGAYARAEWHRFNGTSYERTRAVDLLNPIAPVDIEVTDLGSLVAIDNWHNLGQGSVLVIYSPDGQLVKKFSLSDLYSNSDLARIRTTTSSIHWRCSGISTALNSSTELLVDDSIGGRFVFKLDTGTFTYLRDGGGCR